MKFYTNDKLNVLMTQESKDYDKVIELDNALDTLIKKGLKWPFQVLVDDNFITYINEEAGYLDVDHINNLSDDAIIVDTKSIMMSGKSTAEIINSIDDYIFAIDLASDVAVDEDQKWDNEETLFYFEDGSCLSFKGDEKRVCNGK